MTEASPETRVEVGGVAGERAYNVLRRLRTADGPSFRPPDEYKSLKTACFREFCIELRFRIGADLGNIHCVRLGTGRNVGRLLHLSTIGSPGLSVTHSCSHKLQ